MTTTTQADISVTSAWQDIVEANGSLASVEIVIQNSTARGTNLVFVAAGGGTAPSTTEGHRLAPGDSITVNAANIWVRANRPGGISVSLV